MCNAITESQATMFLKPLSPLTSMLPAVMTLHSTLNTEVTVRDAEYVLSYTLSLYDSEFHLFNPKDEFKFQVQPCPPLHIALDVDLQHHFLWPYTPA